MNVILKHTQCNNNNKPLPQRIRSQFAQLATAVDEIKYPILARHHPAPTRSEVLAQIEIDLGKLRVGGKGGIV